MEQNELLKPRFKVVATYPDSVFYEGEVISFDDKGLTKKYELGTHDEQYPVGYFTDHVKVFQPLKWHEERQPEQLPKYAKMKGSNPFPVLGWKGDIIVWNEQGRGPLAEQCEPSTEAEYIAYTQSK